MVSGSRVLVVEDDAELGLAYQRMLRSDGYEVARAVSLREAREQLLAGCPDLVLLDVALPDGSGIEFCKQLKDDPATQGALVLINSGQHVAPDEVVQGLESGADGYVTKPVQQRVLLSQVRALLRLKASEKELRQANQRLLEFNRLKAEFVANMSHELRTPLTAIIGFAQLLLLHAAKDPMSGNQRDKVERILRNGRHLLSLVDDVLDLSKIEAGRMVLHPEPFDLVAMVEGCFGELLSLAEQKGLDYKLQVVDTFPMAFTDELRVRQILINLLSNAIKFTTAGHIHARLSRVSETEWEFAVNDTGIGIGAEDLTLIFDRFRQVDGSSTREVGGTGLGLTIAQQVAELLGGKITVESVFGEGSTFRVRLPLVAPQLRNVTELGELRQQVGAEVRSFDGTGPVVLVIEDDADARELIGTTLAASGYQVRVASNGGEGILLARELLPAAITLDIMMPSVDGWRVLQSLKSEPRTASIPIVVCSIVDNRPLGYRLGASDYLIKPVEPNDLLQSLHLVGAAAEDDGSSYVLIVDDEPPVRELLTTALREAGFRSRAVPSGEVALATIPERKPAAILCDLMMPGGMSGYEFIARLRSDPETSSVPVVVVTGKDLTKEDAMFLRAQIAEVIRKGDLALHDLQTRLRHTLQEVGVSP